MVTRYDWNAWDDFGSIVGGMFPADEGGWVSYADYAALRAEIETLRAEVAEWKRVSAAQAELHGEAEARAERMAEALREAEKLLKRTPKVTRHMYVGHDRIGWGVQAGNVLAMIRAALAHWDRND